MGHYKFTHKMMAPFKINLTVCKPVEGMSIEQSSIPIQFEKALMYTNPSFRGKTSKRVKILMQEFKKVMETDNFLHICSSMDELFGFFDFYHKNVMKTVQLVDKFFELIHQYEGVTEYVAQQ